MLIIILTRKIGLFLPRFAPGMPRLLDIRYLLEGSERFHTGISDGCKLIRERVQ